MQALVASSGLSGLFWIVVRLRNIHIRIFPTAEREEALCMNVVCQRELPSTTRLLTVKLVIVVNPIEHCCTLSSGLGSRAESCLMSVCCCFSDSFSFRDSPGASSSIYHSIISFGHVSRRQPLTRRRLTVRTSTSAIMVAVGGGELRGKCSIFPRPLTLPRGCHPDQPSQPEPVMPSMLYRLRLPGTRQCPVKCCHSAEAGMTRGVVTLQRRYGGDRFRVPDLRYF
jgi:hypothetical protein